MTDFQTIADDIAFLDDWEERYKYIIDLGRTLEPLSEAEHSDANKVRGCASQVWLVFDETEPDRITFRGDSDAHIVKGLIALLHGLYNGKSASDVLAIDAPAALGTIDLQDHITPQRSNGLTAMIARIRAAAARQDG
ncbi:SufE family protein [Aquisalinus flavus]|uniref:Cysteine desufuration protein SufE n=1 Tax=Aquisalinus flavus TaxID=1526572 RepID=A0A8J2V5N5_9PROT|nr:SufE family protein [Aquisalinus flavus]MBD0426272.1 SufE family protein [Aquisalinus flavus]UNE48157.1 SufE family protein [Aquisalinus flavus]GGD09262.1 cysteine desufuration protein SufE [Aquisalinus flavus]